MIKQRKPTIVFCHGIWADGSCFSKVIPALQADGHEVIAVQYSLESFEEDVAMVKRTLNRVGSPALLVGHSYGGATITASGVDDRVAGLVYIGAVAPDVGETVQDQLNNIPRISFLASRSLTGTPGCFRTGPSFSAETFPRKSRSSSGRHISRLVPTSSTMRDPEHPVEVEAKLVHLVPAGPYRSSRSPAVGFEAHGSHCYRSGKQSRSHALEARRCHRRDPKAAAAVHKKAA